MNRKQRRAALKQSPSPASDPAGQLFAEAVHYERQRKLDDAARAYKRLLALKPDHAEASNNLGCVLQAQGKLTEASARFAQSLTLMPQLLDQFSGICATLAAVLPSIGAAMRRAAAAWPNRLTADELLGSAGLAAIAADPLLLCILQSTPVRDIALERALTSLRLSLLNDAIGANGKTAKDIPVFSGALAKQCFINEYVFASTPDEDSKIDRLKASLGDAIASGADIAPARLSAIAMYLPLHALPDARRLLDRAWPPALAEVLTQQVREPWEERQLRESIPKLTPIDDQVSLRVREQYEENPYPRWVHAAIARTQKTLGDYLRDLYPSAAFTALDESRGLEILVAGCGTGKQAIEETLTYKNARVLAVDLSLASLCYAKRKTPEKLTSVIEYGQADILNLGSLGRTFDVVTAGGVLHHMADPLAAWRTLLALVRPGGFMFVGLYSEIARRDLAPARAFIAEKNYQPTADDIRRFRQDLLNSDLRGVARAGDFFSTSECRDMLFHVQEHRLTIPQIKSFIDENGLTFIGFIFDPRQIKLYSSHFAQAGWSTEDLDRWHDFEMRHPNTFSGMYQFWVQKK